MLWRQIAAAAGFAGSLVLAPDYQRSATEVAGDDGTQHQIAGIKRTRRNRQQCQLGGRGGKAFASYQKAAHQPEIPRRIGDVAAGLGMQQQIGLAGDRGAQAEFELGTMHRLTRLPRNHLAPATPCQQRAQLCGG